MTPETNVAVGALAASRGAGGGYGWRSGGSANTECTALSVMALHAWRDTGQDAGNAYAEGLAWLEARQLPDGGWPLSDEVPGSGWSTSVACCALVQAHTLASDRAARGGRWLLEHRSRGYPLLQRIRMAISRDPPPVDQDQQIPGWGWSADTSAWVEPTAWALLALKQLRSTLPRRAVNDRIDHGQALLADRMCRGGGWNYGNKAVLGYDLLPYPDTTALALLALQDHRSKAVTGASLARLDSLLLENRSGLALALSILAMLQFDRDVSPHRAELRQRLPSLVEGDDVRTLALALLALDERQAHLEVPRYARPA